MQESFKGIPVKSNEICSLAMVRRIAAMLDFNTHSFKNGDKLPRGWHFFLLAGETRKSLLRADGFPGFGVQIPDLGLPRLLLGGRMVSYQGDITIGAELERTSFVTHITEKTTKSGPMAIVAIQNELRNLPEANPAIIEAQTYILLPAKSDKSITEKTPSVQVAGKYHKQVVTDETLLFQYSALGFNTHKIHLDKDYARNVEGYPGLVVNGGLTTLLLTEFIRNDLGFEITSINVKYMAPLFCGDTITIAADLEDTSCLLKVFDSNNVIAVEMDANIKLI